MDNIRTKCFSHERYMHIRNPRDETRILSKGYGQFMQLTRFYNLNVFLAQIAIVGAKAVNTS